VIIVGAAAAGVAGVVAGKGSTASPGGSAVTPLQIGAPTISLGHS
jgi:hypothetical protein